MELQRILCVEDDPDIREVAMLALEVVGGFTVCGCASGAQALEQGPGFKPQLVLLDVMMPHMDGPATLQAMRATPELADVPVVFMTAKVQTDEVQEYMKLGALDVVAKPFEPMRLAELLRAIWERHI
jgi:two-component system, OmpR family, response regulator